MRFEKVSPAHLAHDLEHGERADHALSAEDILSTVKLPSRATSGAAGYDFYLPETVVFRPHRTTIIPTGVCCNLDPGTVLLVVIRSSAAIKHGLRLVNAVGVIDADYYGNPTNGGDIILAIHNDTNDEVVYQAGDRVAQGIVVAHRLTADDASSLFNKRTGGIGSTGGGANEN